MLTRLSIGLGIFIMLSLAVYSAKPDVMFDQKGQPRPFGFRESETIFSIGFVIPFLAIMSFFVATVIEEIMKALRKPSS